VWFYSLCEKLPLIRDGVLCVVIEEKQIIFSYGKEEKTLGGDYVLNQSKKI
jgi:hypothetical protein